jgi:hypothetical protein
LPKPSLVHFKAQNCAHGHSNAIALASDPGYNKWVALLPSLGSLMAHIIFFFFFLFLITSHEIQADHTAEALELLSFEKHHLQSGYEQDQES